MHFSRYVRHETFQHVLESSSGPLSLSFSTSRRSGPLEDLKDQQDTTTQNKQNILPVSRPEDPRPNSQQLPLPPNSPGPERIQYHRFFQTIHFESIRKRTVSPPYRPNVTAIDDITMFPTYGDSAEDSVPDLSKKDKQAWIHELNIPLTSKE